jgi:hypothetical protein
MVDGKVCPNGLMTVTKWLEQTGESLRNLCQNNWHIIKKRHTQMVMGDGTESGAGRGLAVGEPEEVYG